MTLLIIYTTVAVLSFAALLFVPNRRPWWCLVAAALWPVMIVGAVQTALIVAVSDAAGRKGNDPDVA